MNYGSRHISPLDNAEIIVTPSVFVNASTEEEETNAAEDQNERDDGEEGEEEEAESTNVGQAQARQRSTTLLTRRLRCLFSAVIWPLVSLSALVVLSLLCFFYKAFVVDSYSTCSHPIHVYAYVSGTLLIYAPCHLRARSRVGSYNPVCRYDQIFITLCLLYVYGGISLLGTCRDDLVEFNKNDQNVSDDSRFVSACEVTCPGLYDAFATYVTSLEVFTFALLVPLFFLPCLYLWFFRRATVEAETFAQLQETLQAEAQTLIGRGGFTAEEIMDGLDRVRLIKQPSSVNEEPSYKVLKLTKSSLDTATESTDTSIEVSPEDENTALLGRREIVDGKECCICMTDFDVEVATSDMDHRFGAGNSTERNTAKTQSGTVATDVDDDVIVRTKCGHLFHDKCLAGWLGGRWDRRGANEANPGRRRARQTCCPLCREDLRPQTGQSTTFSQFF